MRVSRLALFRPLPAPPEAKATRLARALSPSGAVVPRKPSERREVLLPAHSVKKRRGESEQMQPGHRASPAGCLCALGSVRNSSPGGTQERGRAGNSRTSFAGGVSVNSNEWACAQKPGHRQASSAQRTEGFDKAKSNSRFFFACTRGARARTQRRHARLSSQRATGRTRLGYAGETCTSTEERRFVPQSGRSGGGSQQNILGRGGAPALPAQPPSLTARGSCTARRAGSR